MLNILNYKNATTLVGQTVTLRDKEAELELAAKVASVDTSAIHGEEWSSYSITFELNDSELNVVQGTLQFSHPDFQEELLFVSPHSQSELEAVISQKN